MDLKLHLDEIDTTMTVEGDFEIVVPDYFVLLSDEDLARVSECPARERLVIGVGRLTDTSDVEFITGDGSVWSISGNHFPKGRVSPTNAGSTVKVEHVTLFEIPSERLLKMATPSFKA